MVGFSYFRGIITLIIEMETLGIELSGHPFFKKELNPFTKIL